MNAWSPKPWVVSAEPPDWLRKRATAEAWPGGSVSHWRHRLRELEIESVHAIYREGQLSAIGLDEHFQEIDRQHPAPLDLALRECVARLVDEHTKRTPPQS
jgi:hypothetical protein